MKSDGKKLIYSFRPLYRDLGTNLLIFTGSEVEDITIYKIYKFENHVTRNDDIMMSLPKTMENNRKMRASAEPNKLHIVQKVLMTAVQKCKVY